MVQLPDDGGRDLFVRHSAIVGDGYRSLAESAKGLGGREGSEAKDGALASAGGRGAAVFAHDARRRMAAKRPQTMAKRARELAVKERRDRKRARKAEAAAQRTADREAASGTAEPETEA